MMLTIPHEQMTSEIEGLEKMSKLPSGQQLECEKHSVQIMKWFDHLAILPKVEEDITMSKKFDSLGRKLHCWTPHSGDSKVAPKMLSTTQSN